MEVVFEVVSRAGRILERYRASGPRLSIGRAFDNDLILADETVSPHHAAIETGEDGVVMLLDLNSLNGVRTERHEPIDGPIPLRSGEDYSFGRARVRIYGAAHPVANTVRIGGMDWLINRLGGGPALFAILSLVAAVAITEQWLNTFTEIRYQEIAIGLFGVMTLGVVIAAFWAIVGRIVKHEGRFQTQLGLVMLYLLLQSAVVYSHELLLFNSLNTAISTAFSLIVSFVLSSGVLWISLHIATNLTVRQRWGCATKISGVFLCMAIYPAILKQMEFSGSPDYINEVMPPSVRVFNGVSVEHFVEESTALFAATDHDDQRP